VKEMQSAIKLYKPLKSRNYLKINNKKIEYKVIRRKVKFPRLEFHADSLFLIIPPRKIDYKALINSKKDWIIAKYSKISEIIKKHEDLIKNFLLFGKKVKISFAKDIRIDNKIKVKNFRELKNYLEKLLYKKIIKIANEYSKKLNVDYRKIFIRQQKTKWSSCSLKKNLSFNLKIVSLPEVLIKYLIFHEMLHLIEKKHNHNFILLTQKEFPNYKEMERKLYEYWIILNKNIWWKKLEIVSV
jgi:predicted metal-dependent hydrolase